MKFGIHKNEINDPNRSGRLEKLISICKKTNITQRLNFFPTIVGFYKIVQIHFDERWLSRKTNEHRNIIYTGFYSRSFNCRESFPQQNKLNAYLWAYLWLWKVFYLNFFSKIVETCADWQLAFYMAEIQLICIESVVEIWELPKKRM